MTDAALARLVDRVQSARAAGATLCLRGGGTKDFYGNAPAGEVLPTTELAGVSRYEPTELVVTVRAGTPLAELEATLAEKNQHLAFEPPRLAAPDGTSLPGGTVGGMVAAGLAGPARAAAGGVRDHVLGLSLLDGHGEVLSFGGQVMKNVAGYDVSRLMAGSMGILGVICEVSLKVLPRPAATATLRFEMAQAEALKRVNEWAGDPLPIHASAWWGGMLVLRLAGAHAAVRAASRQLGGEAVDDGLAEAFWTGLRDQRDEFFDAARREVDQGATLWRLSVPQTAPPLSIAGDPLIEWGGAQRWIVSRDGAAAIRDAAAKAGGHATRYLGGDRAAGSFAPLPPVLQRIHRELKRAFDPEGLFNPGRLYPDL